MGTWVRSERTLGLLENWMEGGHTSTINLTYHSILMVQRLASIHILCGLRWHFQTLLLLSVFPIMCQAWNRIWREFLSYLSVFSVPSRILVHHSSRSCSFETRYWGMKSIQLFVLCYVYKNGFCVPFLFKLEAHNHNVKKKLKPGILYFKMLPWCTESPCKINNCIVYQSSHQS